MGLKEKAAAEEAAKVAAAMREEREAEEREAREKLERESAVSSALSAALRSGSARNCHCRVVLSGRGGAGKTSTLRVMMGEALREDEESTAGRLARTHRIHDSTVNLSPW